MTLSGTGANSELPEFTRSWKRRRDGTELELISIHFWESNLGHNNLNGLYTKGNRKGLRQERGRISKIKIR